MISKAKFNTVVGSIGAAIGIFVFVAYIPQIIANMQGAKAQPWQPLFAAVSCLIWVCTVGAKNPEDWILIIPNAVGVIIGISDFSDFALNKGLIYVSPKTKRPHDVKL